MRSRFRQKFSRAVTAIAVAAGVSLAIGVGTARATIVERVVAVIGEKAILFSDLKHRARPVLSQIYDRVPQGPQRSAIESEMYKELLQQMVDENLIQIAADRGQKKVASEEIDQGIKNIAASQSISVDELLAAAIQSGLSLQEFRDQVQRQILEQKMLSLRVFPRVRISSEDVRLGYVKLQRDERKKLGYRLQWIVLRVLPGTSQGAREQRVELANQLASLARGGADFSDLARKYSDDSPTRPKGGDLGAMKPGVLSQQLEDVAMGMDVGEVSQPFIYSGDLVIMRVAERDASALPSITDAHDRIAEEVFKARVSKARQQWLDELKRGVYVDVRM